MDISELDAAELCELMRTLRTDIDSGKIQFRTAALEREFMKSLDEVQYSDVGEVIPASVDGVIRSYLMFNAFVEHREQLRELASLREIQEKYFRIIRTNFGWAYDAMKKFGVGPADYAHALSRNPKLVQEISSKSSEFVEALNQFWLAFADIARIHLQDMQAVKAVFGGDLFPAANENIVSKCGVYIDTTVLPDPLLRAGPILKYQSPQEKTFFVLKHGMNILQYEELALADVPIPIVVIMPECTDLDGKEEEKHRLGELSVSSTLEHWKRTFGEEFESFDELLSRATALCTPEQLADRIKNPRLLLFNSEWSGPPVAQLAEFIAGDGEKFMRMMQSKSIGPSVAMHLQSRMMQAHATLSKGFELRGTPVIDAPTSWQYYNWFMEYNSATDVMDPENIRHMHVAHALENRAHTDLLWLGNISNEKLIEARRLGVLDELRELLSDGLEELLVLNRANFFRTGDQVVENIQRAFAAHQEKLKALREKKAKFFGIDVVASVCTLGVAIAAASLSTPALGVLSAILGSVGVPSVKGLHGSMQGLKREDESIKQSPTGLFFSGLKP